MSGRPDRHRRHGQRGSSRGSAGARADGHKGARLSEDASAHLRRTGRGRRPERTLGPRSLLVRDRPCLPVEDRDPAGARGRTHCHCDALRADGLAFGRAAGLRGAWLHNLFSFAPLRTNRTSITHEGRPAAPHHTGFVETASSLPASVATRPES